MKFFETATEQTCMRVFEEEAALDDEHFEEVGVLFKFHSWLFSWPDCWPTG